MYWNFQRACITIVNSKLFALIVGVVFAIMVLYAFEAFRKCNKEFIQMIEFITVSAVLGLFLLYGFDSYSYNNSYTYFLAVIITFFTYILYKWLKRRLIAVKRWRNKNV